MFLIQDFIQTLNAEFIQYFDKSFVWIPFLILFTISVYKWCNQSVVAPKPPQHHNTCPKTNASFLSKLTFSWFTPMIMKGYRKPLTTQDMWSLEDENQTSVCVERFNKYWKPIVENKEKNEINIFSPILKTFWATLVFNAGIKLTTSLLTFSQPLLLDRLITFMRPDTTEPEWRGYLYALFMFVSAVVATLLNTQCQNSNFMTIMRVKTCITSLLYQKVIKTHYNKQLQLTYHSYTSP